MALKTRRLWAVLTIVGLALAAGCGKTAGTGTGKTADQPLPNTTDSK